MRSQLTNSLLCLLPMWFVTDIPSAAADATFAYQIARDGETPVDKTFAVARFFVRVDSSDEPGEYLLFQAGKFFPLYRVNTKQQTYVRLTPPVEAWLGPDSRSKAQAARPSSDASAMDVTGDAGGVEPETAATNQVAPPAPVAPGRPSDPADAREPAEAAQTDMPAASAEAGPKPAPGRKLPKVAQFKPTGKTDTVAGVRCRIVVELLDGEPAIEHCMANKAALDVTERETRTLARLFGLARTRGWDWLAVATADEDFVSVRSRDLGQGTTFALQSMSTAALPQGHLRMPKGFVQIESAPAAATLEQASTKTAAETEAPSVDVQPSSADKDRVVSPDSNR